MKFEEKISKLEEIINDLESGNTSLEDLAGAAVYFLSSLSSGVTGEISYVDGGYNVVDAMR